MVFSCLCGGIGELALITFLFSFIGTIVAWFKRKTRCACPCHHDAQQSQPAIPDAVSHPAEGGF